MGKRKKKPCADDFDAMGKIETKMKIIFRDVLSEVEKATVGDLSNLIKAKKKFMEAVFKIISRRN